ncbi:DUF72 domain-containing protein [Iamia sp. SCSIO 61187]|uniref:DUF72 domain-containing protein n=1 Tax=Iamia sp. SCSIO 61187 TaxID=2722752 RepID=UPI001C62E9CA|nr:DUF72 domain-containing protein [Iamia sp. SCSIO 61187]QYG91474.1 DUF72 domain-containing protein [Iamia sp. SCSIO 61187]
MSPSTSPRGRARVGCSGWDYKPWSGPFYPAGLPARLRFSHYAEQFDTVELNATFYRLPAVSTVEGWRDQAPPGFCYAVKVSQFATHRRKLREPATWVPNHLDRVEHLGAHLGPNLLQLPPRWRRDTARLDEALAALPRRLRWAVELRDPDWVHDDTFACLARHDVALCIHDLIADHPWVTTTDWTYVRFHGPDARRAPYAGRYTGRRLWRVAERLGEWQDGGCDVFAYFNNDQGAHAPVDAAWLRDRLADGGR